MDHGFRHEEQSVNGVSVPAHVRGKKERLRVGLSASLVEVEFSVSRPGQCRRRAIVEQQGIVDFFCDFPETCTLCTLDARAELRRWCRYPPWLLPAGLT